MFRKFRNIRSQIRKRPFLLRNIAQGARPKFRMFRGTGGPAVA